MAIARLLVFASALLVVSASVFATWTVQPNTADLTLGLAGATNAAGQRAEIFLDKQNQLFLRFILRDGFESFANANCPTFQVDDRLPLHHFVAGDACVIADKTATYNLGAVKDRAIHSLIVHRLMNGNDIHFRYTIRNGQYREATFSLRASKKALKQALGYALEITVD